MSRAFFYNNSTIIPLLLRELPQHEISQETLANSEKTNMPRPDYFVNQSLFSEHLTLKISHIFL